MAKTSTVLKATLMQVPGAVVTGVVREVVGAKINPTWTNVPVAKAAYIMDGVGVLLGVALVAAGAMMNQPVLEDLGSGMLTPSAAYLAQNGTHDVRRVLAKSTATPVAPRAVMMAQPAAAPQIAEFRPALQEDF
jgi:hypothetical protein